MVARTVGSMIAAAILLGWAGAACAEEKPVERQVLKLSEVQMMMRPAPALIITSDEEMEKLEREPNAKCKAFGTGMEDMAKQVEGNDGALINVAYDFFFGGNKREYFPTSPQCIRAFKALHDAARKHGVGFGASVLSPLDLGPAYYREKKRGGQSHQFQEGEIKPDGTFSVPMTVQRLWFHNKGPVLLHVNCVRAFAFDEKRIGNSSYYAVHPSKIVDISVSAKLTITDDESMKMEPIQRPRVAGTVSGRTDKAAGRNRVLAVVVYDVEEMDYFAPDALSYITDMLDAHKAAGISYDSFYSDEMHIQFDWDLGAHFGLTEIDTRYVTPGLVKEFAKRYGKQYLDFEKYLVYFAFAQHQSEGEPEMAQHVFGESDADIYATWKFRRDYFRLLQDHVVDLFITAKRYGEKIFDRKRIWTRAHATWQESPTCDHWDAAWKPKGAPVSKYDYTPAYDWGASIRESTSACCDYFRWGDLLTGNGNDFPEGGWIDRNYYGGAVGASLGAFNDVPYAYWACWGCPQPVGDRVANVNAAFGMSGWMWGVGNVQNWQHRKTPVLALYPMDLNYVEERFGSWMVQYGYCDYLTEEKFAQEAKVLANGHIRIRDREYTTLVTLFQPMISRISMDKLRQMGERGGKVLWTSVPAAIYREDGSDALADWRKLFGVESVRAPWQGVNAEGATVAFRSELAGVPAFRIPTHLLPDLVYPVTAARDTDTAAVVRAGGKLLTLGTVRETEKGGEFAYFGGRPRDDQSASTSDAPRTLFHLLKTIGAYTETGPGWAELVSNTGDLVACESPNGAVSIARHYYTIEENWSGGFFRPEGEKFDESILPTSHLGIKDGKFGPYTVTYEGERLVAFLPTRTGLAGFTGYCTQGITINGREYRFADAPVFLSFAPLPAKQLAAGVKKAWVISSSRIGERKGELVLHLPFAVPDGAKLAVDPKGNGRGVPKPATYTRTKLGTDLTVPAEFEGQTVYLFVEG